MFVTEAARNLTELGRELLHAGLTALTTTPIPQPPTWRPTAAAPRSPMHAAGAVRPHAPAGEATP